jgi:IS30 family transposase
MAARLTDKQKKKIIADRADGLSIRQLANKYHTSTTTIHRTLKSDPETEQKVTQKKEENTADILAYMESKKSVVCNIIGIGLDVLCDPEKLKTANPSQITTALGTLIDKWVMVNGSSGTEAKEDGLSASLRELAKELESE